MIKTITAILSGSDDCIAFSNNLEFLTKLLFLKKVKENNLNNINQEELQVINTTSLIIQSTITATTTAEL